jgi:hypothetical protein
VTGGEQMNLEIIVINEYKNNSESDRKEQFLDRLAIYIMQQESKAS